MYQPLSSDTEIRLLELLPGAEDSPVAGNLLHVDLNDQNRRTYEALSYTWGSEIDERLIWLNGEPVTLRYNLWCFLNRLRATRDAPRLVWVDAICISQTDHEEKARQVQIIGKIFREAERVLAWVGEHADNSEMLFHSASTSTRSRSLYTSPSIKQWTRMALRGDEDEIQQLRMTTWSAFLNRSYWRRTWIIQEIGVARTIIVHCGNDSISWKKLLASESTFWWKLITIRPLSWCLSFHGIKPVSFSTELRNQYWRMHSLVELREDRKLLNRLGWMTLSLGPLGGISLRTGTVLQLVWEFRDTECSDPRDRIFAILWLERQERGLERQHSRLRGKLERFGILKPYQSITVDYKLSLADLFIQVCLARITTAYYPPDLDHATNLFLSLRMGKVDALHVVDYLLDKLTFDRHGNYMFWVIAGALNECGAFGERLFASNSRQPVFASYGSMRTALFEWRAGQKSLGLWYDDVRPVETQAIEFERVSPDG